ncbi:hypothetical protein ACFWI0_30440, partial [[Kitasatospora] papulosa]|uniref:hypothetical protein n=1 Tax=[Kitasatospora] papulosa TaxID=1464011 RepID=UPI003655F486
MARSLGLVPHRSPRPFPAPSWPGTTDRRNATWAAPDLVQDHEALRAPGLTGTHRSPAVTWRTGASSLPDRAEHRAVPIPFSGSGGVVILGLSGNVSLSGRLCGTRTPHTVRTGAGAGTGSR